MFGLYPGHGHNSLQRCHQLGNHDHLRVEKKKGYLSIWPPSLGLGIRDWRLEIGDWRLEIR
ncbi:MAG: hypothetical protein ABIG63_21510 [Chloroflexota bacterium]